MESTQALSRKGFSAVITTTVLADPCPSRRIRARSVPAAAYGRGGRSAFEWHLTESVEMADRTSTLNEMMRNDTVDPIVSQHRGGTS
jgi:hypothetical protein